MSEVKKKPLTPKQIQFCEEYVFDFNGSRAYKKVYPNVTDETARVNASKLLTNTNISEYITEVQKDLSRLSGVTALRNIEELKKIAYSSLQNYHSNWMTLEDWDKVSDADKAAISEMTHTTTGSGEYKKTIVKFRLHDKKGAIELLNKMLGLNAPDKVDLSSMGKSIAPPQPISEKLIDKLIDKL